MRRRSVKQILAMANLINTTDQVKVFRSIGWYVTYKEQTIYFTLNKDIYNYLYKIIDK